MKKDNIEYLQTDWWPRVIEHAFKNNRTPGFGYGMAYELANAAFLIRHEGDVVVLAIEEKYKPLVTHRVTRTLHQKINELLGHPIIVAWSFIPLEAELALQQEDALAKELSDKE